MVDTSQVPQPKPTRRAIVAERAEASIRTIIGGAPIAAVRRIVLYLIAVTAILLGIPVVAVGSVLLLMATDVLR